MIEQAEREDHEVLVTTDQNIRYQQNLSGRQLAVRVLLSTAWPNIRSRTEEIGKALAAIQPGELIEVPI